jgi:transcriptional regulator with XRE-family HTH domain
MAASINRQLTKINPELLSRPKPLEHHQPMVDNDMAGRLKQLKGDLSYEKFGELAGVSATSVMKWMKGGNVTDASLRRLIAHEPYKSQGITVEWIRYGATKAEATRGGLTMLAADVAEKWMQLSPERQDWFRDLIFTMHFMESRFPAMRKGRPKGEHYSGFETAVERDMQQLMLKLE